MGEFGLAPTPNATADMKYRLDQPFSIDFSNARTLTSALQHL